MVDSCEKLFINKKTNTADWQSARVCPRYSRPRVYRRVKDIILPSATGPQLRTGSQFSLKLNLWSCPLLKNYEQPRAEETSQP
ncbi:hypothetical protein J6590_000233 [Homalodisca vitripennis]|nr:hypothetical protein J6590_000233 [Homalodisca vitripennis]